jgi:nicotinate-nucleotide adenylyltransferase
LSDSAAPRTARQAIGVFGGTFDPPHIGHLILAESACDILSLDRVLFVLAGSPPHKQDNGITPTEHRLAMLNSAIAGNPRFVLSDVDLQRPGPHYTADTLRIIQEQHPDTDLFFLLGADSLRDLPAWHQPEQIVAHATLAVMGRLGANVDVETLEARLPGITERMAFVDAPAIGISATDLRERLRIGQSIRYLVPDGVRRYIEEHSQLYRNLTHE